jgi:hypothetical protein
VLAAVAAYQVVAVWTHSLTPWKGAGFGMFSSVDTGMNRPLTIDVFAAGEHYRLASREGIADEILALRFMPTESRVKDLVHRLLGSRFVVLPTSPRRDDVHDAPMRWSDGVRQSFRNAVVQRPNVRLWNEHAVNDGVIVVPEVITLRLYRLRHNAADSVTSCELLLEHSAGAR